MIKNYTLQTFVAWWIGASVGFVVTQLTVVSGGWNGYCTIVSVYTAVLYAVYGLLTEQGYELLEQLKRRLSRRSADH